MAFVLSLGSRLSWGLGSRGSRPGFSEDLIKITGDSSIVEGEGEIMPSDI